LSLILSKNLYSALKNTSDLNMKLVSLEAFVKAEKNGYLRLSFIN